MAANIGWNNTWKHDIIERYVDDVLLLIRWSSQSSWPLRHIHISNDNGSFTFYVHVFFPLSLSRLLLDLTVYISIMAGTAYPSWTHEFTPVFVRVRVAHCFSFLCCPIMCRYVLTLVLWCVAHCFNFLCCPIMCRYVLTLVLWCPLRFLHKNYVRLVFTSSCLYMSYLGYLCLFAHSGVHHMLCCVFGLYFVVLCTLYCKFLWIVHFALHLRYSLTFIKGININNVRTNSMLH
jgi:hypothetical protein